jgi:hypothetical protein
MKGHRKWNRRERNNMMNNLLSGILVKEYKKMMMKNVKPIKIDIQTMILEQNYTKSLQN